MNPIESGLGFSLEFLPEPTLLLGLDGRIHDVNAAGRRFVGEGCEVPRLFDIVHNAKSDVEAFLRRASGSTSPHIGALELTRGESVERFRALAARVQSPDRTGVFLILRLMSVRDDRFSVLNQQLREIARQLHQRRKENAMLLEALEDKKVLVRELQHRVKNNIQLMLTLIRFSAANRTSQEVADLVSAAGSRLHAMAATQEAIYQHEGVATLSACGFLTDVAQGVADSFGASDRLHLSIEDVHVSADLAHSLALVANELLTNAFKYGRGQVSVRFWSSGDGKILEVEDEGPGFDEGILSRSSGLRLVRSLCRQIEGKLQLGGNGCSKCSIQFWTEVE